MKLVHLYLRVLELLGREARLAWVLALANVALAGAMFMEPILFGRIVDQLANAQGHLSELSWSYLVTLVAAWCGFALFSILAGALVALHADRLSHRQRQVVMTDYFEHVLQLPLSWSLHQGERLVLGRARAGARTYLAVRGGWQTQLRLGSRSSEQRLVAGQLLPAEPGSIPVRYPGATGWAAPASEPFHILDGPDGRRPDSGFDATFWEGRPFHVGARSDRMGLRLEGDPVAVASPPERLSAPVAPGAVQVAGGQLIVLGVACGTMGGYPHVAQVTSADLDRLGQLKPGDRIQFRRVTLDDARCEDRRACQARMTFLSRVATLAQDA